MRPRIRVVLQLYVIIADGHPEHSAVHPGFKIFRHVAEFGNHFTRFIHKLARQHGEEMTPWVLEVVSRMPHAQQCRLISDHWKVWPLAFAMRWHALCGLPPVEIATQTMSTLRLKALQKALRTLHSID